MLPKGYHHTDATKAKISAALKGDKNPAKRPESRAKMVAASLGRKLSPLHRSKIAASLRGRKASPETIAKMRRRKMSAETRTRMALAHLGISCSIERKAKLSRAFSGERSHLWRGGISGEKYSLGFTTSLKHEIRARDGFACLICGILENGHAHGVHHIDYQKTNHKKGNLATLCKSCHPLTNQNRECWMDYFGAKL